MSAANAESDESGADTQYATAANEKSEEKEENPTPKQTIYPSESILGPMLNLYCFVGHETFSPDPDYWEGEKCGIEGCQFPLHKKAG